MTIVPCILTYLVYLGTVLTNIIKSQEKLCCMTTHKLKKCWDLAWNLVIPTLLPIIKKLIKDMEYNRLIDNHYKLNLQKFCSQCVIFDGNGDQPPTITVMIF